MLEKFIIHLKTVEGTYGMVVNTSDTEILSKGRSFFKMFRQEY